MMSSLSDLATNDARNDRRARNVIAAVVLVLSAIMLFARLGHYPLWDDEAITALAGEGVLRTGDTTAVLNHNVVGYAGGLLPRSLHDRSTPPLPAYLVAPFLAIVGETSFAARLPFALLGLACVTMMLKWLRRDGASVTTHVLFAAALIGNVSLFLYFRNCRYYGVAIFCSVAIVYLYLRDDHRRSTFVVASLLSLALLASNYLDHAALYVCLGVDYFLVARHRRRLRPLDWVILLGPQVVIGAGIVWIWNPFVTGSAGSFWSNGIGGKLIVFARSWRDINACEYGALPLLLLAPLLYGKNRDPWLLRAPLALGVYMIVMALIAPTPIDRSQYADVRYYAPLIPLCIAIEVLALRQLWKSSRVATIAIAALAFGTNVLHFGMFRPEGVRSTIVDYSVELANPPLDPYSAAIAWVTENVRPSESIAVLPNHCTFPLMFHAPQPIYAWQFTPPAADQLKNLPAIHFRYDSTPDYVMVLGPSIRDVFESNILAGRYQPLARLGAYWQDRYRPELMFRLFKPIGPYDPSFQDIYVFKAALPPATQPLPASAERSSTAPAPTSTTGTSSP